MGNRSRAVLVAVLAGALLVAGVGSAFAVAADPPPTAAGDFATFQAKAVERIERRIAALEGIVERFEGRDGPRAEQAVALATGGIASYEAALAEVEAASTVREVAEAFGSVRKEVRSHARVRRLYAHVEQDIAKFTRRLERLDNAIDRAEAAGADVTAAEAEARSASADLEDARAVLDSVDPSQTGPEVVETLKEAHRTTHAAQKHIRSGWKALFEALPPGAE